MKINGNVAFIGQQPLIFQGTLKENIILDKIFDQELFEIISEKC
jgi:ABC-type transport system involved in cytochrome bd biosynthesis fused ATPase/permease subunit